MNVDGPLENMSGSIVLQPSKTTIDSTYIGDTEGIIDISKSVLNFRKFSLRENQIAGTYDMKTGLADLKLSLTEPDIPKLFKFNDLTFGTFSELSLKGDLNKFNLSGNVNFGNISYKGYKVPSLNAELEYSDGNVDKLFKYGTFNHNYQKSFPPLFNTLKSLTVTYCASEKIPLIRLADITANYIYNGIVQKKKINNICLKFLP